MDFFGRAKSEIAYLRGALRTLSRITPIAKNRTRTYCDLAEELAEKFGDKPALLSDGEVLSFKDYNGRANQYARWAAEHGVEKGDVVALLMPNRPEYLAIWLGVARAGGVTALLNTNLTGHALAHCISIVNPKHVIVAADLAANYMSAEDDLQTDATVWGFGHQTQSWPRLDEAMRTHSADPIPAADRPVLTIEDKCLYIYTSGTTGLPKAANINHYRVQSIMHGFSAAMNMKPEDRIYVCLPMYHTSGGVLAAGAALTVGGSVVIRDRFSASQFWDDIVDFECTVFQYIGELCRYLLNSATHPKENKHQIRLCSGNGLRPDIWMDFKTRFKLPRILEWYAATEGNAVFLNFDGKVGAVGRIPKWAEKRFVTEVIKFDLDEEQSIRGPDGFCIKCHPDEIGEVVSQILNDPARPSQRFEGYADKAATEKKILRDVFTKDDAWFRSGDLMRRDALGYFYFVDRIGDTFRWKGENVATSEVAEAITVFPGIKEANVYGVVVAGRDGRAGMAAIVADDDVDLKGLRAHLDAQLPSYARPLFIRLMRSIDTTGTFKMRKVDLVKDGFDPHHIEDPVFFNDPDGAAMRPIDVALYQSIQSGAIRL